VLTIIEVIRVRARVAATLLNEYFAGYAVSVKGAFIGLFWDSAPDSSWDVRRLLQENLVVAASIFGSGTRAELKANRDFLDHI